MWLVKAALVLGLLLGCGGCSRETLAHKRDLQIFALDYYNLSSANQGEVSWSDFDSLRENYPDLAVQIDRNEVIVVWSAPLQAESEEVMAYEKKVLTYGGLVALCNAEVRQVSPSDFKKMKLATTLAIPFRSAEKVELTGHNPDDTATYVRVMSIRGLRMDLPEELEWSDTHSGYIDANDDFVVQATALPGKDLREALRLAHKVMRSRHVTTANVSELVHAALQGKLIDFDSAGLHQELLVLSDATKMKSVMLSAISKSGSEFAKRTRALMRTVDWQPEYLPDFKVDPAAQEKLESALEAAMEDDLRKACVILQYPVMQLTIEREIPSEYTLMTFGKARIALSPATAFEVNRHELVWMTSPDGQEGFSVRRQR